MQLRMKQDFIKLLAREDEEPLKKKSPELFQFHSRLDVWVNYWGFGCCTPKMNVGKVSWKLLVSWLLWSLSEKSLFELLVVLMKEFFSISNGNWLLTWILYSFQTVSSSDCSPQNIMSRPCRMFDNADFELHLHLQLLLTLSTAPYYEYLIVQLSNCRLLLTITSPTPSPQTLFCTPPHSSLLIFAYASLSPLLTLLLLPLTLLLTYPSSSTEVRAAGSPWPF